MKEVGQALDQFEQDKDVGCVVLTGGDRAFAGRHDKELQNCSRCHSDFLGYFFREIRLDISYESSAWQMIHMKCQVLFPLENNKKSN